MSEKRIRIISVPAGSEPDEIRDAWVGLNLPMLGYRNPLLGNDIRYDCLNRGFFEVAVDAALTALRKHNADAYAWWLENPPSVGKAFRFNAEACVELGG